MVYQIFLTKDSKKELDGLMTDEKKKILSKILLLDFPFSNLLNIKKMSGVDDLFRLKTGKIRAIFFIDDKLKKIIIRKIGYRKDVYRFY